MKTKTEVAEVGVIVGRFQSPYLHEGHLEVIEKVVKNHPRVIIFLGLSPVKCSKNNPLDFQTRKNMIEDVFDVEVHYIEDTMDDAVWSRKLDQQIARLIGPNQKAVLYGGRDSFIPHYKGNLPVIELIPSKFLSAREIRKNVGIRSKDTQEFREGVVWAVENQYPICLSTVDIAIHDVTTDRILLGRKPDETLLRFIGGFSSVDSESYELDARRETIEETGLETGQMEYIGSCLIDDWRYRNEQNKIKTLFFYTRYVFGSPVAADDIAEVRWVDLDTLTPEQLVPNHRKLFEKLKKYLDDLDPQKSIVDADSV